MGIKEYRDLLERQLGKEATVESKKEILEAKRELIQTNNIDIYELISSLENHSIQQQINMIDDYINKNEQLSKEPQKTLNLNYKSMSINNENDYGFSNIILLSIALIIIVIILFAIILV